MLSLQELPPVPSGVSAPSYLNTLWVAQCTQPNWTKDRHTSFSGFFIEVWGSRPSSWTKLPPTSYQWLQFLHVGCIAPADFTTKGVSSMKGLSWKWGETFCGWNLWINCNSTLRVWKHTELNPRPFQLNSGHKTPNLSSFPQDSPNRLSHLLWDLFQPLPHQQGLCDLAARHGLKLQMKGY